MVFEAVKILLPPILAALFGGYLVNRFKSREDAIDKRLDELYSEIRLAATDAENYWKSDPKADDLKILAAKTLAAIVRLDGLRSAIAKHMSQSASDEMAAAASDFMRHATVESSQISFLRRRFWSHRSYGKSAGFFSFFDAE